MQCGKARSNKGIATSSKKLLVTSNKGIAAQLVTSWWKLEQCSGTAPLPHPPSAAFVSGDPLQVEELGQNLEFGGRFVAAAFCT